MVETFGLLLVGMCNLMGMIMLKEVMICNNNIGNIILSLAVLILNTVRLIYLAFLICLSNERSSHEML